MQKNNQYLTRTQNYKGLTSICSGIKRTKEFGSKRTKMMHFVMLLPLVILQLSSFSDQQLITGHFNIIPDMAPTGDPFMQRMVRSKIECQSICMKTTSCFITTSETYENQLLCKLYQETITLVQNYTESQITVAVKGKKLHLSIVGCQHKC